MMTLDANYTLCAGCYLEGFPIKVATVDDTAALELLSAELKINQAKSIGAGNEGRATLVRRDPKSRR